MWYAYADRDIVVMSQGSPQSRRATEDCIGEFATLAEARAWAAADPRSVVWRP